MTFNVLISFKWLPLRGIYSFTIHCKLDCYPHKVKQNLNSYSYKEIKQFLVHRREESAPFYRLSKDKCFLVHLNIECLKPLDYHEH